MSPGSIYGQEGWNDLNASDGSKIVQSVTPGVGPDGSQAWMLSSSVSDGSVCPIAAPSFDPVGESLTTYGKTTAPAYNQFSESFSFRTVATSDDPGLYISTSLGTPASVRMTYLGIEEDGSGNLIVDDYDTDPTGNFVEHSSGDLTWGAWYQVKITADFIDGPDNDQVTYSLLNASGQTIWTNTTGSWETLYTTDPSQEGFPGPIASDRVTFGVGGDSTDKGIYIDNYSDGVSVPEPSTWALLVAAFTGLALWGGRRLAPARG